LILLLWASEREIQGSRKEGALFDKKREETLCGGQLRQQIREIILRGIKQIVVQDPSPFMFIDDGISSTSKILCY
jgi:hypothetical protein